MKKPLIWLCVLLMLGTVALGGCAAPDKSIHIYNWGDYIDMELVNAFEQETGIKVVYSTFASNE